MAATMSLEHHDETTLLFCSMCEQKLRQVLRLSRVDWQHRSKALAKCLHGLDSDGQFEAEILHLGGTSDLYE
jgi:hypothetical protein